MPSCNFHSSGKTHIKEQLYACFKGCSKCYGKKKSRQEEGDCIGESITFLHRVLGETLLKTDI